MGSSRELLLLGDWVIDENWVVVPQQADLSSLTGRVHRRALGSFSSTVRAFCGAGRVASLLWQLNREKDCLIRSHNGSSRFSIVGCGLWALGDGSKMTRQFRPNYSIGLNPFALSRRDSNRTNTDSSTDSSAAEQLPLEGLYLHNLATALCTGPPGPGTMRVYREYKRDPSSDVGLELERRVDFALKPESRLGSPYDPEKLIKSMRVLQNPIRLLQGRSAKGRISARLEHLDAAAPDLELLADAELKKGFKDLLGCAQKLQKTLYETPSVSRHEGAAEPGEARFPLVVVKDLAKGAINRQLLDALLALNLVGPGTRWFISSKDPSPDWVTYLCKNPKFGKVRLWFLPPVASMIRAQSDLPGRWFVQELYPKPEVMDALGKELDQLGDNALVVAMANGLSLLAVEHRDDSGSHRGYKQPEALLDPVDEALAGKASAFFASLVARMVDSSVASSELRKSTESMLEEALADATRFLQHHLALLQAGGDESQVHPPDESSLPQPQVSSFDWQGERERWERSERYLGIVTEGEPSSNQPTVSLQVWRAMRELENFVETVRPRRKTINVLLRRLDAFAVGRSPRSISILIKARSGTGKSYLVSRLAETLGLAFKSFNITQLVTRKDVLACFDSIASFQVRQRSRCLVFFDEINAELENAHVYDLFLSVLEDGTYARGGERFRLDPCAWIFAGTELLLAEDEITIIQDVCRRNTVAVDRLKNLKNRLLTNVWEALPENPGDCVQNLMDYRSTKAPDFVSRLSERFALDPRDLQDEEVKLGYVYAGVLKLLSLNHSIKYVELRVLKALYNLPIGTSMRELGRHIEECHNIRSDTVGIEILGERLRNIAQEEEETIDGYPGNTPVRIDLRAR